MSNKGNNIPPIDGSITYQAVPPVTTVTTDSLPETGSENQVYIDSSSYSMSIYKDGEYHSISGSGGTKSAIYLGYIKTSFPTSRSDGSELVAGDYVAPDPSLEFPVTIGGITFTNKSDKAAWIGTKWVLNPSSYQYTSEVPVKDKSKESITGLDTVKTQYEINIENVQSYLESIHNYSSTRTYKSSKLVYYNGAIWQSLVNNNLNHEPSSANSSYWLRLTSSKYIYNQSTKSKIWTIDHNLNSKTLFVTCKINDYTTSILDINYVSNDQLQIVFPEEYSGIAILY